MIVVISSSLVILFTRIIIKNTGRNVLRSLEIKYGLKGKKKEIFTWNGELNFLEKEEVWLPAPNWRKYKSSLIFEVEVLNPNGILDEYPNNNYLSSGIVPPVLLPKQFVINILTNGHGRACENEYIISNDLGEIKYFRDDLEDYTEYNDEIMLKSGCYEFRLTDKQDDGMNRHWWYRNSNPDLVGENGNIQIFSIEGELIRQFNYDFGQELLLRFRVE